MFVFLARAASYFRHNQQLLQSGLIRDVARTYCQQYDNIRSGVIPTVGFSIDDDGHDGVQFYEHGSVRQSASGIMKSRSKSPNQTGVWRGSDVSTGSTA